MSTKKVHNAPIKPYLRDLHGALIEIVSAMNRPQRDDDLMQEAGVTLDRALFRLLIGVERFGPIGVVDLAERVGLDYTTVSRQVAKLDSLGLVLRQGSKQDGRVREAVITPNGKVIADKLDAARERLSRQVFEDWAEQDVADLSRLMCRFAEAFRPDPKDTA
jgi:DNA-binding MarR family transcriptional regulator